MHVSLSGLETSICERRYSTSEVVSGRRQEEFRETRWSAYKKGCIASVSPNSPSGWRSRHDPSIYTRARGEEGEGRGEHRLLGQVLLHMPGGMAGASHRGILLKVRQADLPVTSA